MEKLSSVTNVQIFTFYYQTESLGLSDFDLILVIGGTILLF